MKEQSEQLAFYQVLGANIRERRKNLGLSQEALARLVGLTRTSLTNIENGRQHPPLHTFCELIDHLKVDAAALLPRRVNTTDGNGSAMQAIIAQHTRTPDEVAFITANIGLRGQEKADGDTQEKNRGNGSRTPEGERSRAGAGAGDQDRKGKGRADRR